MSVLVPKKAVVSQGFPIGMTLNKKETKGDVGLEIEIEGRKLPTQEYNFEYWKYSIDHSLRGAENAEYVLRNPVKFKDVGKALDDLWKAFSSWKSQLDDSNRTSVHVHLNVQQFHLNRLTSFMALYFCFEELLTEWCGDHRVGNLFCLRAKDAPAIISQIRRFIKSDGKTELKDNLHYSGLNVHALHKFGSLEIRTLRGVTNKEVVQNWVSILQRLYEVSADYPDPREICHSFSADGPVGFFDTILGGQGSTIRNTIGWDSSRISASMLEGIRLAQDLCYCRDWSMFKEVQLKNDPFGRALKGVARKVSNMTVFDIESMWVPDTNQVMPAVLNHYGAGNNPFFIQAAEVAEAEPEPEFDEPDEDEDDDF